MNNFFKPLLLTGFFSNLLIGEDSIIDSVFNSLFIHPGKYALELSQDYIISENFSSAELYILDRKNLFIRLSDFDLLLKENSFFSFYSNQKTVVIDKYINTEFNLISILTGDWKTYTIVGIAENLNSKSIDFLIQDYDISGNIKIDDNYFPLSIKIDYSIDESFQINLKYLDKNIFHFNKLIPDTSDWEMIDFRE